MLVDFVFFVIFSLVFLWICKFSLVFFWICKLMLLTYKNTDIHISCNQIFVDNFVENRLNSGVRKRNLRTTEFVMSVDLSSSCWGYLFKKV